MIVYILEFALIHSLFFLVYKLLLTTESHLTFRRFFLLGSTALSLIIPLIEIPTSFSSIATINLAEVMVPFDGVVRSDFLPETTITQTPWYVWLIGGVGFILLLRLYFGLIKIANWYSQSQFGELFNTPVRMVKGLQNSFTFLRWVFIDPDHFKNTSAVVRHEWGHSRHLHSIDVLFFNFLTIPFWWIPSIWFMLNEAKKVHEYQADQFALKSTETQSYVKTLVHGAIKLHGMNLASSFDDAPIVKRLKFIKMMKRKMNPWKVGSIAAIMAITAVMFACEDELDAEIDRIAQESNQQLVYSDAVKAELEELTAKFPDMEFAVIETDIENKESFDKINSYDPEQIKRIFINRDGDYKTMTVILAKGEALFERTIATANAGEDDVFTIVEEQPQFPGGINEFYEYVGSRINYPKKASDLGIEGKVYIQFIVDTDGSVTNIQPVKGIHPECDAEAVRVMKTIPNFIPGKQKGRAVRVRMTIPIVFALDGDNPPKKDTSEIMEKIAEEHQN